MCKTLTVEFVTAVLLFPQKLTGKQAVSHLTLLELPFSLPHTKIQFTHRNSNEITTKQHKRKK